MPQDTKPANGITKAPCSAFIQFASMGDNHDYRSPEFDKGREPRFDQLISPLICMLSLKRALVWSVAGFFLVLTASLARRATVRLTMQLGAVFFVGGA